jgi:hypothetical protein
MGDSRGGWEKRAGHPPPPLPYSFIPFALIMKIESIVCLDQSLYWIEILHFLRNPVTPNSSLVKYLFLLLIGSFMGCPVGGA